MIEIRERSDTDLAECVRMLRDVHALGEYPVNWPADPQAWLTPADRLGCWVAIRDGRVVGHAALTGDRPEVAEVERLFVDPKATRAGVGRRLLGRTPIDWAGDRASHLLHFESPA
jgi:GNAT superfamily N-acetyltransferase